MIFWSNINEKKMLLRPETQRSVWSVPPFFWLFLLPKCCCMFVAALTHARKSSGWLWFSILKVNIWLVSWWEELVDILEKLPHALGEWLAVTEWLELSGNQSRVLQKLVSVRIKQRPRPKTRRGLFIHLSSFELLSWCLCVFMIMFVYKVLFTAVCTLCVCAGPHILFVLQNLTCLRWTLAVYTRSCSPWPNLLSCLCH